MSLSYPSSDDATISISPLSVMLLSLYWLPCNSILLPVWIYTRCHIATKKQTLTGKSAANIATQLTHSGPEWHVYHSRKTTYNLGKRYIWNHLIKLLLDFLPVQLLNRKYIYKQILHGESHSSSWPGLQWRHNEHDGFSNHQLHDCLFNSLFRRRWKKTSKLCVTGLCVGNSPVTGEFPAQRASNTENVSIWWRHHANADTDS